MRLVVLYARSRGVPAAALALLALCATGAGAGRWLAARPSLDPTTARLPVTVALALCLAVVLAATLHSAADELERTTPRAWAGWRAAHALGAAAAGLLLASPVLPPAAYGASSLLRNLVGLLGLALVGAAVVGPRLAWLPPLAYAATVYLAAGVSDGDGRPVWAFVMQPAGSAAALGSAALVMAAGTAVWTTTARAPMR